MKKRNKSEFDIDISGTSIAPNHRDLPHLKRHTQVIHFDNGEERTITNVNRTERGKWTHIFCEDDRGAREIIVNDSRVLFVRIYA